MPYFTKKGLGKNKGKTCVYKKSTKKKVGCTSGPVEKYLAALHINEDDDWDWVREIEIDLIPGKIYDIKTGNGYYWAPEKFIGREWDNEHDVEMYRFKSLDRSGSGSRSISYVKDLMKKGYIREYDPNWSIKNEITFSDNIEDALKGNFVIYFKDGVYLDQTLSIQDKLFEMGFSFYTKGPNEYITNEDSPKKIQFFESFNWDTSNPRYKKMPSNQRDQKKILLSSVKDDEWSWKPKPIPRLDDQELFSTVVDHDAIVINGDKYITNNINESDDFDWVREIPGTEEYGQDYRYFESNVCYNAFYNDDTGEDDCTEGGSYFFKIPKTIVPEIWDYEAEDEYFAGPGDEGEAVIEWAIENDIIDPNDVDMFEFVTEHDKKTWCIAWGNYEDKKECAEFINESDDFDWVREIPVALHVGQCFKDKMDPSNTEWVIEKIGKTIGNTDVIYVSDGEETKMLHKKMVEDDFFVGRYVDCGEESVINESDDFDWVRSQEPEKEIRKSKKYVVDVSHLRAAPMKHSHDPSLTKQDILRKLEEIGYDVDHIDVDRAKYFYVEPTETGSPSWQYNEYGVPIEFYYWVDYNTDLMDDPSYGGKYQTIDVDEFMFLIDNNMISESNDFDWLDMGEPMSVCEAVNQLESGETIMVDELLGWEDSDDYDGSSVTNVTAKVLAIDDCNNIQHNNLSKEKTILIHVNEEYDGFDQHWVNSFKPEYRKECEDGRCMFLMCGDKVKITKMGSKIFGENKKPINEVAGISFEVRKWAEIIENKIENNQNEGKRVIIDGYDHPEAFDGFPIDYIVIDFHDRMTGYNEDHSGYDKDGNYVVHLFIEPHLIFGHSEFSLRSALNHEMKHAWEDYNRVSKGLPGLEQTKESKELYNKDYASMLLDRNVEGPIKSILTYYYYLSKLEKSAFLENVYDQNAKYEGVVRSIAGMDFSNFKDRFDLEVNWHLINTKYDIPFLKKFKSTHDFIDYSAEELRSRALKMIKKINKMKYVHGKT